MALSGDNCGRTFSNAEVAAEGLPAGSLYGIRAGCPNSSIFEFCDGTLPGGSRSYDTLRHGKIYDGDQDFDQLSDMEFVFGGQSVGVGSILSHLNHSETFPTGCATHSGENIGKVFPRNLVESADVRLGHVYDKSSDQPAFSVGGICDDMAAAQVMPGFLPGRSQEPTVGSMEGDVLPSQVNFPFRTTQAVKSDLPSCHCKKHEPENKKAETDDFDWSTFSVIDPLHRFSQISGPKSNQSEGRWFHSTPNFGDARITEPFVTNEGTPAPVKDSLANDSFHLISQDEHNKPQISTTVPHIFAREVPSSGSANEFSAEPTPVFRPPATCKLETDPDSLECGGRSAGNTFETVPPTIILTSAGISVESIRGSACTFKIQTAASDESNVKEGRKNPSSSSSTRSQPVLDRRKTQEAKLFFDPRRIFATESKPQQKTSQQKRTIEESKTSDCARGAEKQKESAETTSNKAHDGAKSKETQRRMEEKVASKTSDSTGNTEAQKKSDEKTSKPGSKNCVLNNNKSQAQSHSGHTLDGSHFIKNDLSDLWKQKNPDLGRGVHDRSSGQEQVPSRPRETQGTEVVEDEQPALRKVENTADVVDERRDIRSGNDSTKRSSHLLKIIKEKILSFAGSSLFLFHSQVYGSYVKSLHFTVFSQLIKTILRLFPIFDFISCHLFQFLTF